MLSSALRPALVAALVAGAVSAQTVYDVSATPQISFEPNTLSNVKKGDKIRVTFSAVPHDIISGSWDAPCAFNSAGGVSSGVHRAGYSFTFTVNSTDPQVYYCSVGDHCQDGMSMVINPSGDKTLDAYQKASTNAKTVEPESDQPMGGVVQMDSGSMASSSSGSASMAPSSSVPSSGGQMSGGSQTSSGGQMSSGSGSSNALASAPAPSTGSAPSSSGPASSSGPSSSSSGSSSPAPAPAQAPAASSGNATSKGAAGKSEAASGVRSSLAMVAALVAGAMAFVL